MVWTAHEFYNLVTKLLQSSEWLENNELFLFHNKVYFPNVRGDLHLLRVSANIV